MRSSLECGLWLVWLCKLSYGGIASHYSHSERGDPVPILVLTWKFLSNHSIPDVFVDIWGIPSPLTSPWPNMTTSLTCTNQNKNTKINSEGLTAIHTKNLHLPNFLTIQYKLWSVICSIICELVVTDYRLQDNTAQEKGNGRKGPPSEPEPMTYTLLWSFRHASYGISHALLFPIAPYVPDTGVSLTAPCPWG